MVSLLHICFKTFKSRTTEVGASRMTVYQSLQSFILFIKKVGLTICSIRSYIKKILNEFLWKHLCSVIKLTWKITTSYSFCGAWEVFWVYFWWLLLFLVLVLGFFWSCKTVEYFRMEWISGSHLIQPPAQNRSKCVRLLRHVYLTLEWI